MTRILTFALLLAVAVGAACGGKGKAVAPTTTTTQPAGSGSEQAAPGGEHGNLRPELNAFHELLAPLWHAPAGAQRIADTCAAIDRFKAAADAVGKSTPPVQTNADSWTKATRALVAAVDDLAAACAAKADAKFEAAFAKVHDAFHALMKQAQTAADASGAGAGSDKPGAGSGGGNGSGSAKPPAPQGHDHDHKH